ncbi:hypothetical protein ACNS7O_18300 (plasmid) [Haloferacaceae archaeon DSL9]
MSPETLSVDLQKIRELEARVAQLEFQLEAERASQTEQRRTVASHARLKSCTTCGVVYARCGPDYVMEQCRTCERGILRTL